MPSVYIKTYGCQMNERDSEAVAAQLVAKGYTLAASEAVADVILLNTCSVRDAAEQKAIGKMRTLAAETRHKRPNVVLGFMGCMAQSRGRQLIDQLPDVDLVIGTQKFHRTADYLDEIITGRQDKVVDVEAETGSEATIREHLLHGTGHVNGNGLNGGDTDTGGHPAKAGPLQVTAFVSIMQGCNQHCTFCIVPDTRGAERSRTIPDIIAECQELVARGVREITLLGQIVTSYGRRQPPHPNPLPQGGEGIELSIPSSNSYPMGAGHIPIKDGKTPFVQLLEAVHEIEGLERIRFTSPHPKGYGDDLVDAYVRLPKLVESAHIPAQSGSDRILKLMHRGYTRARFMGILEKLRRARPEMGITTDLIVGFPGETEEDFAETLLLAREAEFDNAFIFKYSPRKDTPAATMAGQLAQSVKEERNAELLRVINEIAARKYNGYVGRRAEILVEGPSKRNPARMMGRTRSNKIVVIEGSERHRGQVMDVKITRAGAFTLYGDPAILNLEDK